MAHRVARPARYQGGASFNVFSAQGSNPTGDCKVCGKGVQKLYDKSVKTYVYSLCGGPASKLQLPKDENKTGLQLLQPFVVFQIFVPTNQPLAFELRVTDTSNTRRKMYFSTSFSDIKSTPLHCQIPITMIIRSIWLSLSIHVGDLFAHCFKGMILKSVDTIVLGPVCKLRKIFTMRYRLSDVGSLSNSFDVNNEDYLPQEHMFAHGVDNAIQVLDMMALQNTIIDLTHPSHGTEEDTTKHRKMKLNKLESRQVHVAFGYRMPLPLSTVQINTNLPGDNKPHPIKAFPKERERIDRANRNARPQLEIPTAIPEQNRVENKIENKSETLQNLLKHANNFNKNHAMMRLKKDQILWDQGKLPTIDEFAEKSHNVHFKTQELQVPSNLTIIDAYKQTQKPIEVGIEGIMALTSLTRDDMMNMLSKEDPTITHLQLSNDEVHPIQMPQLTSLDNEATNGETLDTGTNKVFSEEPPKKIEEYKLPDSTMGLGKYVRRSSHTNSNKRKEYKQSRYTNSPPESPPCGWISCIEDDNEEKPLKLPSFFSKICDNSDDLERSKDSIDVGSTITSNSHLMDLEDGKWCTEEGVQKFLSDNNAKYDYSSENLYTEQSMKDIMVRSTSESIINFMEERPRPTGVTHEKFDLGNGDNFMFHDSEFAEAMSDEDYSFGRHSCSSNDHSQNEQGGGQSLVIDTTSSKNSHDMLQEISTFQNDDKTNKVDDSTNHSLKFLKKYIDDDDYFEFDNIIRDDHIENLRLSPIVTRPQSRSSYKDTKVSTCNEDALHRIFVSSLDSTESISKHSISSFTLKNEQRNVKEVEISNCIVEHEDAGITVNNGRPDEDLDLLYDPTLDCYYDPKTNRYYELK